MGAVSTIVREGLEKALEKAGGLLSKVTTRKVVVGAAGTGGAFETVETLDNAVDTFKKISDAGTKWGGMINGAKNVGIAVVAVAAVYAAWQGVKALFGSKEEEPQMPSQGQWAARVGGLRSGQGMSHTEMLQAQAAAAQGQYQNFNG